MITMDIRRERHADAAAVRALVNAAFGPEGGVAPFVDAVRREAQVCLAEVADADGAIVAHAQWCDAPIVVDGKVVKAAYLCCLAADPALQGRGIGARLVRDGLGQLAARGYAAATLLGDPAYYARFGFSPGLAARIEAPHRARGDGFQAVELIPGALDGTRIRADFPAVIAPC